MHILDIFQAHPTTFSFEFFPPRTEQASRDLLTRFAGSKPFNRRSCRSRTARGARPASEPTTWSCESRREQPHGRLASHLRLPLARRTLEDSRPIRGVGIENILALAGDPPRLLPNHDRSTDAFTHAEGLVGYLKSLKNSADPRGFGIGVAGFPEGHPATPNRLLEMDYLKRKVDAGADYICTQVFFNNHDFYDFRERCELAAIKVPILAGIMPITSREGMIRIAEFALGARIPARLLRSVERCGDDPESVAKVGTHWATEQCRDLLDHNVRGIHFYTLNRSDATRRIYENLGVKDSPALRA